ncbi:MAG: hypothetical protein ACH350_07470 [Parachlamydiaceae bacterium]
MELSSFSLNPTEKKNQPVDFSQPQTRSHIQSEDSQISQISHAILLDIDRNKENLTLKNHTIARQTVLGFACLAHKKHELTRQNLTRDVYELTGMSIHAGENYPTVDRFIQGIELAVNTLQEAYQNTKSDSDKLRLIRQGLDSGGCFEHRVETLYDFLKESDTLSGLLKFEIMEMNISKNKSKFEPVSLDELILFLDSRFFFTLHHLDKEMFSEHPVISKLRDKNLIISTQAKSPMTLIHEAFAQYPNYGHGKEAFIEYLKTEMKNYPENELENLFEKYFEQNPDKTHWI